MKNLHWFLLIVSLLNITLTACKKSDNNSNTSGDYSIKFKLDGTDKTMTGAHGGISLTGTVASAAIYGKFANDTAKESSILILDSLPINTSKTYRCILVKANGKNDVVQTAYTYYDEHNIRYIATYTGYITGPHPDLEINVKFTEITSSHLKGTFDASIERYGEKQPYTVHPITDGQFNIKRDY